MSEFKDILGILGNLLRALGFLALGFGIGRFVLDNYQKAGWQVQVALVLGFFGLVVGITDFATAGSTGAFALGAGVALIMAQLSKKQPEPDDAPEVEEKKKK